MIKAFCLNLFENGDVVGSCYVKLFFCKKLLDRGLGVTANFSLHCLYITQKRFNPLAPSSVILLNINHTILMMLVQRI